MVRSTVEARRARRAEQREQESETDDNPVHDRSSVVQVKAADPGLCPAGLFFAADTVRRKEEKIR